jgi:ATP-binding cassette subfamily B multidrug efflux pump
MMFGGGRHMQGVLSQEQAKPVATGKAVRRLLMYFRPFWGLLTLVAVLIVISTGLRLAAPYLTGVAVDQFIAPGDQPRPAWLRGLLDALGSVQGPEGVSRNT